MKNISVKLLLIPALVLPLLAGCTNKQGETESPVTLEVSVPDSPGFVNIATPSAVQFATITVQSFLKNSTATDPQHFADVNINQYIVTYFRTDGGTIVPPPETFGGISGVVPSGGITTLNNFPGMYAYALQQSPFDQLLPFNGGIDQQTGRTEIDTSFQFVFYGETISGDRVVSEPGYSPVIFDFSAQ